MRLGQRLRVNARFLLFLLKEFRWPILVFSLLVLVGGALYLNFHQPDDPEKTLSYAEACYTIFMLIFMEGAGEFPHEWYLQPLFFLVPIIGLGAVADSVVRLAYLIFTNKNHLPQWQRVLASLHRDHVVVIGVGRLGYHVIRGLLANGETVVGVDLQEKSPLYREIDELGIPLLHGDGRSKQVLIRAGVARARAIVLATDNDLANLDAALTAQDINPRIRVTLRMFDDTLAAKFAGAYRLATISTAQVSAPAFIARALGRRVYQEFRLGERTLHVVDIKVGELAGMTVGDIQSHKEVNVLLHLRGDLETINPPHELLLEPDDIILVVAEAEPMIAVEAVNQRGICSPLGSRPSEGAIEDLDHWRDHILVIGGGRTGYRIAKALLLLRERVLVIDQESETLSLDEIRDLGIPVLKGNARQARTLKQAGVAHAKAVICSTSDDLVNLDSALTSLDLNPNIRVTVRLFDDTLADKFESAFRMPALSASKVAAPAFVAAAAGRRLYQELSIGARSLHLTDFEIDPASPMAGKTVGQIQSAYQINIVMHQGAEGENVNPQHDLLVQGGDVLLAIAPLSCLSKINGRGEAAIVISHQ